MLVLPEVRQQCLLWCAASLCLSATVLLLDWTTVAKIARFEGGTQIWCNRTEDSLNLGGQTLHRLNLRLMRNISCAAVLVYLEWFRRNSLLNSVSQPKIAKNSLKPPIFGFKVVQNHRCWYHLKARQQCLLWCMVNQSVFISNRFHATRANGGKITISKGGTPFWCPRSRGVSLPSGTKLPRKKLETLGYHTVKTRSLYITWPWIGTGSWQTDGHGRIELP